ncbi:MAG: hypothetical protein RL385_3500, partial [Pseudomonadota bacterium]
ARELLGGGGLAPRLCWSSAYTARAPQCFVDLAPRDVALQLRLGAALDAHLLNKLLGALTVSKKAGCKLAAVRCGTQPHACASRPGQVVGAREEGAYAIAKGRIKSASAGGLQLCKLLGHMRTQIDRLRGRTRGVMFGLGAIQGFGSSAEGRS